MLTQVSPSEILGKTVKAYHTSTYGENKLYIVFTDGTFVAFRTEQEFDESPWITGGDPVKDEKDGFLNDRTTCLDLGIYTDGEWETARANREAVAKAALEERERAELARLKWKFEEGEKWLKENVGKPIPPDAVIPGTNIPSNTRHSYNV